MVLILLVISYVLLLFYSLKKVELAICLSLCMFGLEQLMHSVTPALMAYPSAINIAIGFIILICFLVKLLKKGPRTLIFTMPPEYWVVICLYLYAFCSLIWAYNAAESIDAWKHSWPYIVSMILISPLILTNKLEVHGTLKLLFWISGALSLALMIFPKWEGRHIYFSHSISLVENNPLEVGTVGALALFSSVFYISKKNKIFVIIRWLVGITGLLLIIRSGSRGQLISALLCVMIFYPMISNKFKLTHIISWSILLSILVFATYWGIDNYGQDDVRWTQDKSGEDILGRINGALILLNEWISNGIITSILGLGNGSAYHLIGYYPHLVSIEILAEEGIIGFGMLMILIILSTLKIIKIVRSKKHSISLVHQASYMFWCSLLLFYFLLSMKQGSLLGNLNLFFSMIIIGKIYKFMIFDIKKKRNYV